MKRIAILLILVTLCVVSCEMKEQEDNGKFVKATVLGIGGDCRLLLINFDEEIPELAKSPVPNVYYAHNIPEEFQVEGKRIEVQLGQFPKGFELPACTMMGPTYSSVYVVKVRLLTQ